MGSKKTGLSVNYCEAFVASWPISPDDYRVPIVNYLQAHEVALQKLVPVPKGVEPSELYISRKLKGKGTTVLEFIKAGFWVLVYPKKPRKRRSTIGELEIHPPLSAPATVAPDSYRLQLAYSEVKFDVSFPPSFFNMKVGDVLVHPSFVEQVTIHLSSVMGLLADMTLVYKVNPDTSTARNKKLTLHDDFICYLENGQPLGRAQEENVQMFDKGPESDQEQLRASPSWLYDSGDVVQSSETKGEEELGPSSQSRVHNSGGIEKLETETPKDEGDPGEFKTLSLIYKMMKEWEAEMEKKLEEVKAEMKKDNEEIKKELEKGKAQHKDFQSIMDSKFATQNNEINMLKETTKVHGETITTLKLKVSGLNEEIRKLKESNTSMQSQINTLEDEKSILNLRINQLRMIVEEVSGKAGEIFIGKLLEEFRQRTVAWIHGEHLKEQMLHLTYTLDPQGNVSPDSWNTLVNSYSADLANGLNVPAFVFFRTKFETGSLEEKGSIAAHSFDEPMDFYARVVCETTAEKPSLEAIFWFIYGRNARDVHIVERTCYKCPLHCSNKCHSCPEHCAGTSK